MRFSFFLSPKVAENWILPFFKWKSCAFIEFCSFEQQQIFHASSSAKALNVKARWCGSVSVSPIARNFLEICLGVFWKPSFLLSEWVVWPGNQPSHTSLLTSLHPFRFTKYLFLDMCVPGRWSGRLLAAALCWAQTFLRTHCRARAATALLVLVSSGSCLNYHAMCCCIISKVLSGFSWANCVSEQLYQYSLQSTCVLVLCKKSIVTRPPLPLDPPGVWISG